MKLDLDFVVIGAQKAGTTALFEYLRRHPDLALPENKEAPYFSHDSNFERPWEEYLRKTFPFAEGSRRWGTVTTHYMVGGLYQASEDSIERGLAGDERTVPRRIRERLPDVRLIAVLRDPVQRAMSHYRMMVMTGAERRSPSQAFSELLEPEALEATRRLPQETSGYVIWGEYARILDGYLDVFAPEQLLVIFSDELQSATRETLARVHAFIGVRDVAPDNLGESYRVGAGRRKLRRLNLYDAQRAVSDSRAVRSMWRALPEPARRRLDQAFDRASYRVDLWNRRANETEEAPDADTISRLRDHYSADAERLAARFRTTPPWHLQEMEEDYASL